MNEAICRRRLPIVEKKSPMTQIVVLHRKLILKQSVQQELNEQPAANVIH